MGTSTFSQGDAYVNGAVVITPGGANGLIQYNNSGSFGGYTSAQDQGAIVTSAAYASLPAASANRGQEAFATDVGASGAFVVSDGTRWKPKGGLLSLFQNNTPFALTGTTVETTVYTVPVPAGLLGPSGRLEFDSAWTNTANGTTKLAPIRINGTLIRSISSGSNLYTDSKCILRAAGSTSSQFTTGTTTVYSPYYVSTVAALATTFDTTAPLTITATLQLASAADTITLQAFSITLVTP